ncbi:unnamed protein product [Clonostachys rosea]|uniref:Bacterial alpha-L-rhamnosidase N-terminal domain-containing protein n=1 Tax=Bionectria ochroleuca TaxID=29856 RepID=A0ABY6UYC4_BIOOC|nr:unnamed protein product [Clonostachys rosea]
MSRAPVEVISLRFEHHPTGLGISTATPRPTLDGEHGDIVAQGWFQTAYELEIRRPWRLAVASQDSEIVSFYVEGSSNAFNPWPDKPLTSRERADVRVRVHGRRGGLAETSEWTAWVRIEAALLSHEDWSAQMITTTEPSDRTVIRPIRLRKVFQLPKISLNGVGLARLYLTALGIYEVYLNGHKVGDEYFAPGWTSFHHRLQYQVYDAGHLLRHGNDVIAIEVASGMYAGRLLWNEEYRFAFLGDRVFGMA